MEELKPVAWMWEHFGTRVTTNKKNAIDLEKFGVNLTPLYAIPDGYALVPVEPTKTMIDAMCEVIAYCGPESDYVEDAISTYKAMLSDATFPRGSVVDDEV